MKNRNLQHSDNWGTPKDLYDKLNTEFSFDFDPCPIHIGEVPAEKDGLLLEWGRINFVNPPYSRAIKESFVKKGIKLKEKGHTSVFLLPVSTSTKLFHEHILPNADDIRFLKGRVKFTKFDELGESSVGGAGMHDSMIVVFKGATQ